MICFFHFTKRSVSIYLFFIIFCCLSFSLSLSFYLILSHYLSLFLSLYLSLSVSRTFSLTISFSLTIPLSLSLSLSLFLSDYFSLFLYYYLSLFLSQKCPLLIHLMQIYGRFHPCYFRNDGVINVRIEDLIDELKVAPVPTLFSGKS